MTMHDTVAVTKYCVSIYDKDNDGCISEDEFKGMLDILISFYRRLKGTSLQEFLLEADTNKDGKVDIQECAMWFAARAKLLQLILVMSLQFRNFVYYCFQCPINYGNVKQQSLRVATFNYCQKNDKHFGGYDVGLPDSNNTFTDLFLLSNHRRFFAVCKFMEDCCAGLFPVTSFYEITSFVRK